MTDRDEECGTILERYIGGEIVEDTYGLFGNGGVRNRSFILVVIVHLDDLGIGSSGLNGRGGARIGDLETREIDD